MGGGGAEAVEMVQSRTTASETNKIVVEPQRVDIEPLETFTTMEFGWSPPGIAWLRNLEHLTVD